MSKIDNSLTSKQYIGGQWRDGSSSKVLEVHDPSTHELVASFKMATPDDIDEAYKSAAEAQKAWAAMPYLAKRPIFEKAAKWADDHHEEMVDILVSEGGSSRLKAEFELSLVADMLRTSAALTTHPVGEILTSPDPEKENRLYYEPVGVVGVISPFNAPLFLSLRPVAPALAYGNGVVIKANELTPIASGTLIARMFEESGLPKGLLNIVVTDVSEMGDSFVEHPIPEVIAFTGSAPTGKHIAEVGGRHLKKVISELGGNSAMIILEDADIETAVNAAVFSRMTHSGQICMSANRVIVHEKVYDEFLKRYVEKAASVPAGDAHDPKNIITPLINAQQAELLEKQVREAIENGAKAALEAKPREEGSSLCTPVILTDVTPDNPASQIEFFGPVAAVMKATDEADAIRLANATQYGLSGAVHTKNLERGVRVGRQIHTGMVHINNGTIADEAAVPFGGVGLSGNGRLNGEANREAFTRPLWVSVHHGTAQFPY